MGTAIKHSVPDRVKPSVWHRMFYSGIHMATVGVKGLTQLALKVYIYRQVNLSSIQTQSQKIIHKFTTHINNS